MNNFSLFYDFLCIKIFNIEFYWDLQFIKKNNIMT